VCVLAVAGRWFSARHVGERGSPSRQRRRRHVLQVWTACLPAGATPSVDRTTISPPLLPRLRAHRHTAARQQPQAVLPKGKSTSPTAAGSRVQQTYWSPEVVDLDCKQYWTRSNFRRTMCGAGNTPTSGKRKTNGSRNTEDGGRGYVFWSRSEESTTTDHCHSAARINWQWDLQRPESSGYKTLEQSGSYFSRFRLSSGASNSWGWKHEDRWTNTARKG